ncbi:MAG: hypothetical protein ACI82Q_002979, partial [Nonlabens sp.]
FTVNLIHYDDSIALIHGQVIHCVKLIQEVVSN